MAAYSDDELSGDLLSEGRSSGDELSVDLASDFTISIVDTIEEKVEMLYAIFNSDIVRAAAHLKKECKQKTLTITLAMEINLLFLVKCFPEETHKHKMLQQALEIYKRWEGDRGKILLHLSAGGYPSREGITLKNIIDFWTNEPAPTPAPHRLRPAESPQFALAPQPPREQELSLPKIAEETKEIFMALFSSVSIPQRTAPTTAFTAEELNSITTPILDQLKLFFSDKNHPKNLAHLAGIQDGFQARHTDLGLSAKDIQDIMAHLTNQYYVWWSREVCSIHRDKIPLMDHRPDSPFFPLPSVTTAPPHSFPSSRPHPSLQQNKEIEDTSFALFLSAFTKETLIPARPSSSSSTSRPAFTEEQLDNITNSIIDIYQSDFSSEPAQRGDYLRGIRRGLETFELSIVDVNSIMSYLPGQIDVFLALQLSLTC